MAKKRDEKEYSVILDTSFMIRLLNDSDPLHSNARGYFRYFLENDVPMYFSTVSVAEYCVRGDFDDLPFRNIRILPFNIFHAREAGRFADALFKAKSDKIIDVPDRLIIPNDPKLFAQGAYEKDIKYFVTADTRSKRNSEVVRRCCAADIEHLDIHTPYGTTFGQIDFDSM